MDGSTDMEARNEPVPVNQLSNPKNQMPGHVPKRKPVPTRPKLTEYEPDSVQTQEKVRLDKQDLHFAHSPIVSVVEKRQSFLSPTTTLQYLRLEKPIIVPGLCVLDKTYHPIGVPFVRGYPQCLSKYNINENEFLSFIDHLNIMLRGHTQSFSNVSKVGGAVQAISTFDPTQITKLVGMGIQVGAMAGNWLAIEGGISRKANFLTNANKTIFNPRNLHVKMIDTEELKRMFNLPKDFVLMAPLDAKWETITMERLQKGERSAIRTPRRLLMTIKDHVEDIILWAEANPITCGHGMPDDANIDQAEIKLFRSKNAQDIRQLQIGAELTNELARSEAITLLRKAESMPAGTQKEVKEKMKLYKKSHEQDREVHATKKMKFLVINNLNY